MRLFLASWLCFGAIANASPPTKIKTIYKDSIGTRHTRYILTEKHALRGAIHALDLPGTAKQTLRVLIRERQFTGSRSSAVSLPMTLMIASHF